MNDSAMRMKNIVSLVLRLMAAGLMLQTLYFKFTAQPESVYIFTQVGIEPWGRIATGVAELAASILLLLPATITLGAILGVGIMLGAVATHVGILGIDVQGDGGQLFAYALTILVACLVLLVMHRQQLLQWKKRVLG
jgi:uncharacterized membrane protein YphA (DoxX/SURF4 family)